MIIRIKIPRIEFQNPPISGDCWFPVPALTIEGCQLEDPFGIIRVDRNGSFQRSLCHIKVATMSSPLALCDKYRGCLALSPCRDCSFLQPLFAQGSRPGETRPGRSTSQARLLAGVSVKQGRLPQLLVEKALQV